MFSSKKLNWKGGAKAKYTLFSPLVGRFNLVQQKSQFTGSSLEENMQTIQQILVSNFYQNLFS